MESNMVREFIDKQMDRKRKESGRMERESDGSMRRYDIN
jgi:hypothetical protein